MESLYLIVPAALILFGIAVAMFFWSVDDGQYEDLEGEGSRILYDEDLDAMSEAGPLAKGRSEPGGQASAPSEAPDDALSDTRDERDQDGKS